MAALREIFARFGVDFDDRELKQGDKAVKSTTANLRKLGAVLASSAIVLGVRNFVNDIREQGDKLDKVSSKLGLTTAALQEYRFAAGQTGVKQQALDIGLQRFIRRVAEAQHGTGSAKKILDEYNIALEDSAGRARSSEEVLGDVADTMKGLTSDQDRLRLAFKLFDSEGVSLVNTLKGGKEGLEGLRQEFRDLGGGLSEEAIRNSVELTDALGRFDVAMLSVKSRLAVVLLPAVEFFVGALTRLFGWIRKVHEETNIFQSALGALGVFGIFRLSRAIGPLGGGLLSLIRIFGRLARRILLPILVFDELITTFQGGDTLLRRAIDHIFGEGTTARWVENIKKVFGGVQWFFDQLRKDPAEFAQQFSQAIADMSRDVHENFGGALGFLFDAFISTIDLMTGGWDNFVSQITGAWNDGVSLLVAAVMTLHDHVMSVVGSIANAFASMWNGVISGAQNLVGGLSKTLSKIPGLGSAFKSAGGDIRGQLENLKVSLVDTNVPGLSERVRQVSAPVTNNTLNGANTTVNVTVPPGTPEQTARNIGKATNYYLQPTRRSALNAVSFTGG